VLQKLNLGQRFALAIGIIVLGFVSYSVWSFMTLNRLMVNGPVYAEVVKQKDLVADILPPPAYVLESYLVALQLQQSGSDADGKALVERLTSLRNDFNSRQQYWSAQGLEPTQAQLLQQSQQGAEQFYAVAFRDFIPALQSRNGRAVHRHRAGQSRHHADGSGHPAERRAGGAVRGGSDVAQR